MRTIAEIVADLGKATTEQERNTLIDELSQARTAQQPDNVTQLRTQVTVAASQRNQLIGEYDQITDSAVDDKGNARDFTPEEAEKRGRLAAQIDQAKTQHTQLEDQLRQAIEDQREQRFQDQVKEMRQQLGIGDQSTGLAGITSINEPRTYARGNGFGYLYDLTVQSFGPGLGSAWSQSRARLDRHARENDFHARELEEKIARRSAQERAKNSSKAEAYFVRQMVEACFDRQLAKGQSPVANNVLSYRALSTAAGAGGEFVPPMYLTEQWIKFLRAGRVFANAMHHEDLPDGTMSINIPKVTSGTTVAAQGTQNTNVSSTDLQTAFVTVPVVTFAGQQIVSLQELERSPINFDQVVMDDLARGHAQYTDQMCVNGTGLVGQPVGLLNTAGINTVTWTQATPTLKGLYGQVAYGKTLIHNSIFLPATHQFLTPNAWGWVEQTFDTSNRPVVVPSYNGPFNAVAVDDDDDIAEGVTGKQMLGMHTYQDANIPQTLGSGNNQDVDIIGRLEEAYLYESPIVTRALPQTYGAQMSVLLQLYNYAAVTFARYPTAFAVVTGTGMSQSNRTFNS